MNIPASPGSINSFQERYPDTPINEVDDLYTQRLIEYKAAVDESFQPGIGYHALKATNLSRLVASTKK